MTSKATLMLAELRLSDLDRFWSRVLIGDDCWEWTSQKLPSGYGQFWVRNVSLLAHRVSLTVKLGRPPTHQALHSCDNPSCVRPDHLRDGTQLENVADAMQRTPGASVPPHRPGSHNGFSKLTEADVTLIRELAATGESYASLGRRFRVTGRCISGIARRRTWRHVA